MPAAAISGLLKKGGEVEGHKGGMCWGCWREWEEDLGVDVMEISCPYV